MVRACSLCPCTILMPRGAEAARRSTAATWTWWREEKRHAADAVHDRPRLGRRRAGPACKVVHRAPLRHCGTAPGGELQPVRRLCLRLHDTLGDFEREKAQASYLGQYTRAARIHAGIANGIVQLHHVFGVVYADDVMGDTTFKRCRGFRTTMSATPIRALTWTSGLSFTNRTSDPVARRAAVQSIAATASALGRLHRPADGRCRGFRIDGHAFRMGERAALSEHDQPHNLRRSGQ